MQAIKKISPLDLARPQISVHMPKSEYNHQSQSRFVQGEVVLATTWNATQTFNNAGNPSDKDNDK
jgi:hypothetical protein